MRLHKNRIAWLALVLGVLRGHRKVLELLGKADEWKDFGGNFGKAWERVENGMRQPSKHLSAVWNSVPLSHLASLALILNEIMTSFYRVYKEQCLVLQMFIKNLKTAGFLRAKLSECYKRGPHSDFSMCQIIFRANVCSLCCKLDLLQCTSTCIEKWQEILQNNSWECGAHVSVKRK